MDLFGTAGIRGSVRDHVTPELALAVGRAVAKDGTEFVLARDGRETGPALTAALEAGLESGGATVRRAGQLPTPALAFASRRRRGVMVTASHNPPSDNGIKLFVDGREYDREAERRIESRIETEGESAVTTTVSATATDTGSNTKADTTAGTPTTVTATSWDKWGTSTRIDVLSAYRTDVVEYATGHGEPLDGASVVVDCGNGMASLATPQVLRELGAKIVALNANVDGHFPGRASKPTPESLTDLRSFVADSDATLGIGHDGDADRIVIVDGDGDIVHEDTVVAILAEHYVRESTAADPVVVTTPNASARIDERVRTAGGRVERVRLGALHEGIDAARERGDERTTVVFAAEPWKHIHPAAGEWIDGVVSAAVIARLAAETSLGALRSPVTERPYRKESVSCPDAQKNDVMTRLETTLPDRFPDATASTEYGVRMEFPDAAWVLVRPSGTEPYVRVYAESDDVPSLIEETLEAVRDAVETV